MSNDAKILAATNSMIEMLSQVSPARRLAVLMAAAIIVDAAKIEEWDETKRQFLVTLP